MKIVKTLKTRGLQFIIDKIVMRLYYRKKYINYFQGKSGLEIGGPSNIFKNNGDVPIYKVIKQLDGCNYSNTTLWEGTIVPNDENNFYVLKDGKQYISEASLLKFAPNSVYDFIITSHTLEHLANPIKAIKEWLRVIKDDGYLLIIVPKKEYCFDFYRKVTEFKHLINDFETDIDENDLSHLNEFIESYKLYNKGTFPYDFKESLNINNKLRIIHHHVFDNSLFQEIIKYFNLKSILATSLTDHIILCQKHKT